MKILLLQDPTSSAVLRHCLADQGHKVVVCHDAQEAHSAQAKAHFPLIIVDLEDASQSELFCRSLPRPGLPNRSYLLVGIEPGSAEACRALAVGADELLPRPHDAPALAARLLAVEHQITQRVEWQRLQQLLNTRAQQQVAIAALGQCALSEEIPTLLDQMSRFIIYTLEVEFCSLLELCEGGQKVRFSGGFGWREGYLGAVQALPSAESLTGRTLRGEDLIVEDLQHDARFSAPDFLREHGIVSALCVAVKGKQMGVLGALGAYTASSRRFGEDDLRFLEGLANVLGAAIERRQSDAEIQKHQNQVQHLQRLESVGQLAAGLAHDYNNVLSIIHGHVTLALGDSQLPPATAASLKTVLDSVERAAGLTRQMLSFSRKQEMHSAPVDLNATLANLIKLLDRVLGANIRVELKPAAMLPAVEADTGMLDQVLMNLAVNARDAMPDGGRLLIRTSVESVDSTRAKRQADAREGDFVCLAVSDTGCGMDEATIRRIFDPFFTTKAPGKGTGLGLSTVYGIVKQHQGWVEVQSHPGQGTTFLIFLPSLGQPLAASASYSPSGASAAGHETILLVEDEPTLRELAKLLLESLGYRILDAGSGLEALKVWAAHKEAVGVLLTDLVMPDGVTGFELAKRLQQERPELKVIFTSGYSADKVRQSLPPDSGFHFVQKPYRAETLGQAIREALAQ